MQLAHHVLSPSVAIPLVIGSHMHADEARDRSGRQAANAAAKDRNLLQRMPRAAGIPVMAGAESAIASRTTWHPSPATAAIVAEAMREDGRPLYYCARTGLTELALAWLSGPRIGRRLRLVWIGGEEHAGLASAHRALPKLNTTWASTRWRRKSSLTRATSRYGRCRAMPNRQMVFNLADLGDLAATGPSAHYLQTQVQAVVDRVARNAAVRHQAALGETFILGDSPLVALTALQSSFQPDPSSSRYVAMPTPHLTAQGHYEPAPNARPMRVCTWIDTRLTFADMIAKFRHA